MPMFMHKGGLEEELCVKKTDSVGLGAKAKLYQSAGSFN
ncbi:hypothetical protein GEOBRER4_n2502 [Citrifermentans bremense]|uniref:Uncharacterized protein n=1 Tax=Citrifermentans bremense TaxID=60035 RepID=A0A7R7FSB8_9BACT|nr:hypothetical protein GEOBRER4_n2502 [Citrifermentans bremense]